LKEPEVVVPTAGVVELDVVVVDVFTIASLLALWGVGCFAYTIGTGIGVWGNNKTVGWAWDITNFRATLQRLCCRARLLTSVSSASSGSMSG
jgi:hypothetical protein